MEELSLFYVSMKVKKKDNDSILSCAKTKNQQRLQSAVFSLTFISVRMSVACLFT